VKMFALLAASILFLAQAYGAELETTIADLEEGDRRDDYVLVKAEAEGKALWAEGRDRDLIAAFRIAAANGQTVKLTYNRSDRVIYGAELLELPTNAVMERGFANVPNPLDPAFQFTVIPDLATAQALWQSLDGRTKHNSQCYNRAHGWAYDMFSRRGIKSGKAFIFFTSKYIRQHDYEWWFHVAPYVMVQTENMSLEHVLDRKFSRGPRNLRAWTNIFMYNDALCPEVTKYSDYRRNQQAEWCYLIKTSMFFRSPRDIENLEKLGTMRTEFSIPQVRASRRQAFSNWRQYNP